MLGRFIGKLIQVICQMLHNMNGLGQKIRKDEFTSNIVRLTPKSKFRKSDQTKPAEYHLLRKEREMRFGSWAKHVEVSCSKNRNTQHEQTNQNIYIKQMQFC